MDSNSKSSFSSAVRTYEKEIRAHFNPAQQLLQSVLELSRSQVAVLQGDNSLARHFHVPLACDSIAKRVGSLFGELRVLTDENGKLDDDIRWIDVLLAPTYEPTPQEDGSFHLRLDGHKGLIKMSKSDHDLIMTGMPRQLLHPRSHPSDVLAEEETMELVKQELSLLNELASQIIDMNNDGLSRLGERLEALEQLRNEPGHSQKSRQNYSIRTDSQTHVQCENSTDSPEQMTRRAFPSMRLWTSEELDRVPQWFRARKHLPQEDVVAQFEQDFGYHRSFGAIQTASYRRNPRKRRRTLPPANPSHRPTTTEPASVTKLPNIAPRSLTSDSAPRASIPFLDVLKRFPRSEIPRAEVNQPEDSSAELLQPSHVEEHMENNAADRTSQNEHSNSSDASSEIGSPGQAVTGIPCPTVREAVSVSSGDGRQLAQLGSTNDRDGNDPGTNTETCDSVTHASFLPINLGSRPGSGAVDVRARASKTVATIPTANSDKLDIRKTDSGSPGHADIADSDVGPTRGNSVPGPQTATGAQPDGEVTQSDDLDKLRERIQSSISRYERRCLSEWLQVTEPRTIADAYGPSRPQSSNTNRSQNLSRLNSHIPAAQQIDYSGVQSAETEKLQSQSHEQHPCQTGTATPAAPSPSGKPDDASQSTPKKRMTRSRTGCSACRKKRVECDENNPTCNNCVLSGLTCDGPRKPRKPRRRKPSARQPTEGASSLLDGNQVNFGERIDSPGATHVDDCTTPFGIFVGGQQALSRSLVSPTACELPTIANLGPGRYEIPSIRQIFDLTSISPH